MTESDEKKITELIKHKGKFSYSFEVTPDVSEDEIRKLSVDPLFFSVTWHSKSHKCESLEIAPLKTACLLRSLQKHVLLHLSCDMLRKDYLDMLLKLLQDNGICNLFVVLGENYDGASSDFKDTSELIKYVRVKTGEYFCIGVASFPACSDEKLAQMKEKIECGANFFLTQAFFDVNVYKEFQERCGKSGINVPIIPGVFAFETHKQLIGFINLCKIKVSEDLMQSVKNTEQLNVPCIDVTKKLIQNLNSKCNVTHFHFFTLNKLQSVSDICKLLEQL